MTAHFVPELNLPSDFELHTPVANFGLRSGKYETGRYHLFVKLFLPESATGISASDVTMEQDWELMRHAPSETAPAGELVFKALSGPGRWHHEGKALIVDVEVFDRCMMRWMIDSPTIPRDQLRNTIGLEVFAGNI